MEPKITKKVHSNVAQDKSTLEQKESFQGVKRSSSTQWPPIFPASKKSKKKQSVSAEDQFDSAKFVDLQAAHLYKALGKAITSDSKVFDFGFLHECGLELIEPFQ